MLSLAAALVTLLRGLGSLKFGMTEGIDKPFLYDLVFEKEDTAHTGASKVHRYDCNPDTQTSRSCGCAAATLDRATNDDRGQHWQTFGLCRLRLR